MVLPKIFCAVLGQKGTTSLRRRFILLRHVLFYWHVMYQSIPRPPIPLPGIPRAFDERLVPHSGAFDVKRGPTGRAFDFNKNVGKHDKKVMTDLHGLPMWLFWSRRIVTFKLYYCSNEHVFEGFSLFVGDYWRFFKNCFQQRLILYEAPMFHQYLF